MFSQFDNDGHNNYTELKQKNIDTGMGLERLACVCQNVDSLFDVDTVMNITHKVSELTGAHYGETEKRDVSLRVITDHIRSATFMICDGILPSNEGRGYVLRNLLRRAARHGKLLGVNDPFLYQVVDTVIHENEGQYPDLREKQTYITKVIRTEEENFGRTIDGGMKIFTELLSAHKEKGETVFSGADAFKLYDTYGFPIEMTVELAKERNLTVDTAGFEEAFRKHQELSHQGAEQKFKGGLADTSEETARLHTATHLLHAALRKVLGDEVAQKGSNITAERLRFDFSFGRKVTKDELAQVEKMVNEAIQAKVPVVCEEMTVPEAKEKGAIGLFESKYGEKVRTYKMGDYSFEICGGPHAQNTGDLGTFKIQKEESSSAGVRRIKAVLIPDQK